MKFTAAKIPHMYSTKKLYKPQHMSSIQLTMNNLKKAIERAMEGIAGVAGGDSRVTSHLQEISKCIGFAEQEFAKQEFLLNLVPHNVRGLMSHNMQLSCGISVRDHEIANLKAEISDRDREIANLKADLAAKAEEASLNLHLYRLSEMMLVQQEAEQAEIVAKHTKDTAAMQSGMDKTIAKLTAENVKLVAEIAKITADGSPETNALKEELKNAEAKLVSRVAKDVIARKELRQKEAELKRNYTEALGRLIGENRALKNENNEQKRMAAACALSNADSLSSLFEALSPYGE